jgi:chondroitin AC lyase
MVKCATIILALLAGGALAADAEIETVRARFITSILPPTAAAKADLIAKANAHATGLRGDGSWADLDYADRSRTYWQPLTHLDRVLIMSRASRLSGDRSLLPKIHAALDFWLRGDFSSPNWWQNEIGAPRLLAQTLICLGPDVTPQQLAKSKVVLRRSDWKRWTGQNLVWGVTIQILRGLIENDADAVTTAYARLYGEVRITTTEGIQPDFSFHQHGPQFYSGGYGMGFAQDVPRYASFAWGTRWQMPDDKLAILTGYLLDGEQWMMHRGRFDYSAVGRQITRKGGSGVPRSWTSGPINRIGAAYGLTNAVALLAQHPTPRQDELKRFAERLAGDDRDPLVGNRHFWRSDYMAHHRPGWFASVRMFSTRLLNTEIVNDEGRKSQHLADGCNMLYVEDDAYYDIFPTWDWMKIPGTTAEAALDVEEPRSIGVRGKSSFVGGVSDGAYGVAAMHLVRGKLAARKFWFFFDEGYLCLGAGITCASDNPVATTINQCLLRGGIERGDGWIRHADVGYIVPRRQQTQLTTGERQGRWSDIGAGSDDLVRKKVFCLWIDHGIRPADATYEYLVLPRATREEPAAAAARSPVRIARNTPQLQAAVHQTSQTIACVFAEAGTLATGKTNIAVDQPCLLLLRDRKLTLANPNNAPLVVNVRVNNHPVHVELPDGDAAGSSRTVTID